MDTPRKIGRYEVIEELGRGAMGTVYRAKDPTMGRIVAIKTIISMALASNQGDEFRERFYREARAAGALAHPGIVPVFDVGEHEGTPFLVMEFVTGKTLADAVKKGERLSLDRVCEMGQKLAEAIGYAHQKGVVHRDIKPANILLTSREVYGIERPKITDFGVAKLAEGQTTLTGQMLGTPAFMPPEQFTGAPIDGRADIFSLGVVLYWMATAEQPFPGESMTAVSYKVVHTEPVPPRKLNPSLPSGLDSVILKCLAKNPSDRYQTGEDLARDLGELRAGEKTGATLRTALPASAPAPLDPDATVIGMSQPAATGQFPSAQLPSAGLQPGTGATPSQNGPIIAPQSKRAFQLVLAGVALAVVAVGWYAVRSRQKPEAQVAASSEAPAAVTPPPAASSTAPMQAPTPIAAANPSVTVAPVAAAATPAKKPDAKVGGLKLDPKTAPAAAPILPVAPPEPAPLGFDPTNLDPKQNAKLKIEMDKMPPGLIFTVEMNGKLYFRQTSADDKSANKLKDQDFYVPPGVQEFRVTALSGATTKSSNTVSDEFKVKKRKTLKIELRTQGTAPGTGVPQGLYENSQLVATLK